jgi:hypothetical protein
MRVFEQISFRSGAFGHTHLPNIQTLKGLLQKEMKYA